MGVRWIRLDTTWSQSEWLADLPAPSRLAWVELLCFVKSHGVAGSVKRPSNAYLARHWDISKNAIEVMFAAAFQDSALVKDGQDLIVTGWSGRQMDKGAAERMRAYRERQKEVGLELDLKNVTPVTRNSPNTPLRARAPDSDIDSDIDKRTSSPTPPSRPSAREDDGEIEKELRACQPTAKLNIIAIHGDTEEDVTIEGHQVGVGIEIEVYKRLCREGRDPPEIIAAAIAHIPAVSEIEPPVSLARWGADDGMPIYEQCVGRAYKEVSP
jgi:hypothetical protein